MHKNSFVIFVRTHTPTIFHLNKDKTNLKIKAKWGSTNIFGLSLRPTQSILHLYCKLLKSLNFCNSSNWCSLCKLSHHCLRRWRNIKANQGVIGTSNLDTASSISSRFKNRTSLTSLAFGFSVTSFVEIVYSQFHVLPRCRRQYLRNEFWLDNESFPVEFHELVYPIRS